MRLNGCPKDERSDNFYNFITAKKVEQMRNLNKKNLPR